MLKKKDKQFKFETRHVSTVPLSSSVDAEYKVSCLVSNLKCLSLFLKY